MPSAPRSANDHLNIRGSAVIYRLFDVGYAIDLNRVQALLAPATLERARPERVEAQALQIPNPPVAVSVRTRDLVIDDATCRTVLSARFFDFGVCSLQLEVVPTDDLDWDAFVAFSRVLRRSGEVSQILEEELASLRERVAPAIERPALAPVSEEYMVFRVSQLRDGTGATVDPSSALSDERLAPLLLGEPRPLAPTAMRALLSHRFSYYLDDLVVLSWENALVLEPAVNDRDVEYILEFANAQLLELRVYDSALDAELPLMYDQVAEARQRRLPLPTRRFQGVLARLLARVADVTETVERAENALKVTDDVYLARIYAGALELFRAQEWRRGIERKLEIFRETYAMLNDEAQAARAELLEIAILLIIVVELILGLVR